MTTFRNQCSLVISKTVFEWLEFAEFESDFAARHLDMPQLFTLPDGSLVVEDDMPVNSFADEIVQKIRNAARSYDEVHLPLYSHESCLGKRFIDAIKEMPRKRYELFFFGDWVADLPGSSYRILQQQGNDLDESPREDFTISLVSPKRLSRKSQISFSNLVDQFRETCPVVNGTKRSEVRIATKMFPYGFQLSMDARVLDPIFFVYFNCCLINEKLLGVISTVATTTNTILVEFANRKLTKTKVPIEEVLSKGDADQTRGP